MARTLRTRRGIALLLAGTVAATAQGILGLSVAQAVPPEVSLTLTPCSSSCEDPTPPKRTKVSYANSSVKYGGNASAGARVVSASLFRYAADASQAGEPMTAKVEATSLPTAVLLGGFKSSPNVSAIHAGWLVLEVTVENSAGERTTARSNQVYVDNVHPSISGTYLTDTGTVDVRFSEPVRDPVPGNLGVDWALWTTDEETGEPQQHYWNSATPEHPFDEVTVGEDRSLRTLHLSSDFIQDQDATPGIEYRPAEQSTNAGLEDVFNQYRDEAGLSVTGGSRHDFAAQDLVRPDYTPSIDAIVGVTGGIGTDPTPAFEVSGLRVDGPVEGPAGRHKARIYLETSDPANGLQTSGPEADALIGSAVAAEDGTAMVPTDDALGDGLDDGTYTFYAAAADRALCNPPNGTEECPNVGDGSDPVSYLLDTIAPAPLSAELKAPQGVADVIDVRFSEGISPAEGAGLWMVTANGVPITVDSVSGAGDLRTLHLAEEAGELPVLVSWAPSPDGYADVAGNGLAAFDALNALNDVPLEIQVSAPSLTKASSVTLHGTVTHGLTPRDPSMPASVSVDVFVDDNGDAIPDDVDGDGEPDTPVTLDATSGSFQATFGLPADGPHGFTAIGHRNQPSHPTLPVVDSSPVTVQVVRDTLPPTVTISPLEREAYSGWSESGNTEVSVSWSAREANGFSEGTAVMMWRPSAGVDWQPVDNIEFTQGPDPDDPTMRRAQGTATFRIDRDKMPDTGPTPTAEIQIRITDLVDLTGSQTSTPFRIDSTPPDFTAVTIDTVTVRVRFTEKVQGGTNPGDPNPLRDEEWRLNEKLADVGPPSTDAQERLNFTLRALPGEEEWDGNGNPNPIVSYVPLNPPHPKYRDEALNPIELWPLIPGVEGLPVERKDVEAADGIAPGPATLNAVPALVDRGSILLTGVGDGTQGNQVVVRRTAPTDATYSSIVNANGTFDVLAGLAQDSVNVFRVAVEDPAGNSSGVRQVVITEDSSGPLVTVKDNKKRIKAKTKALNVAWTSVEPHPGHSALSLELKRRNGKTRTLTISEQTDDDGFEKVRLPNNLRKKMRKGKIKAVRFHVFSFDILGHAGSDDGRWIKVRGKKRRR